MLESFWYPTALAKNLSTFAGSMPKFIQSLNRYLPDTCQGEVGALSWRERGLGEAVASGRGQMEPEQLQG